VTTYAFALAALVAVLAEGAAAAAPPWQRAAPLRHARAAHAVVSDGRAIYALAGTDERGAPVREVERFDGSRWRSETQLPGPALNAPAAVVLDGRIYVIGGFGGVGNVPVATVRTYDMSTKRWNVVAPLPSPRGGHAAVVLDGRIHVLGGGNDQRTLADHSVYDVKTNTWEELAPLPRSKGSVAAVVHRAHIYAIGGRSGGSDFGDVDLYDPSTNRWTSGPRIPPRATIGAVSYRGTIYAFGGESQASGSTLRTALRLSGTGKSWARAAAMPAARSFARAVAFRDAVYVVGGSPFTQTSHAPVGSKSVFRFSAPR
jgi:N-acetylneuraminic acid mutarotase